MGELLDLDLLRKRDPDACARFYVECAPAVLGWAIRLGGAGVDPEDAVQDVFAVAFRQIHRFRGDAAPTTWLFAIARRVLANARRRAAIRRFLGLDAVADRPDPDGGPAEHAERRRERLRVQRALGALTAYQREIVVLVDLEERSFAEAAEMLGIPPGTVSSRACSARRAFARALREIP